MSEPQGKIAVVGADFRDGGDDAIATAMRMLNEGSLRRVHLLHVLDPRDAVADWTGADPRCEALALAPTLLHDRAIELCAMADLDFIGDRIFAQARSGEVDATLLQMVADCHADVLIVGTPARSGLDSAMSAQLVREARCEVLFARPADLPGRSRLERADPDCVPLKELRSTRPRDRTAEDGVAAPLDFGAVPSRQAGARVL